MIKPMKLRMDISNSISVVPVVEEIIMQESPSYKLSLLSIYRKLTIKFKSTKSHMK